MDIYRNLAGMNVPPQWQRIAVEADAQRELNLAESAVSEGLAIDGTMRKATTRGGVTVYTWQRYPSGGEFRHVLKVVSDD